MNKEGHWMLFMHVLHERARKVETQKLSQYLYTTDFTVHDFTEQLFAKLFSVATLFGWFRSLKRFGPGVRDFNN